VAPLREGGGTKIKVLESLKLGRTCVVTPHAQRGYGQVLRDGQSLLVGETDEELAAACVRLIEQPELRDRLAATGQEVVRERYSWNGFSRSVRDAITRVVDGRAN